MPDPIDLRLELTPASAPPKAAPAPRPLFFTITSSDWARMLALRRARRRERSPSGPPLRTSLT